MKPPIEYRPSRKGNKMGERVRAKPETREEPGKEKATDPLKQCGPCSSTSFDRTTYQRDYMRDKRAAGKLGITVKEYRAGKDT